VPRTWARLGYALACMQEVKDHLQYRNMSFTWEKVELKGIRTSDLLHAMPSGFVRRRPARSCYGTSGRRSWLAGSGCVCRGLGALSLGLSLAYLCPQVAPHRVGQALKLSAAEHLVRRAAVQTVLLVGHLPAVPSQSRAGVIGYPWTRVAQVKLGPGLKERRDLPSPLGS
jgi:hypothetical protein